MGGEIGEIGERGERGGWVVPHRFHDMGPGDELLFFVAQFEGERENTENNAQSEEVGCTHTHTHTYTTHAHTYIHYTHTTPRERTP